MTLKDNEYDVHFHETGEFNGTYLHDKTRKKINYVIRSNCEMSDTNQRFLSSYKELDPG